MKTVETVCTLSSMNGLWSIELFDDGTLWVQSNYKVRQNRGWIVMQGARLPHALPKYVATMVRFVLAGDES